MSNYSDAVKKVGKFFGISRSQSEDLRNKTERQIQEGEFGITLKVTVSKQNHEQDKFVYGAKKMLSRIGAFQAFEESQERLDETSDTNVDKARSKEPVAGTSKHIEDIEIPSLTLTTPKHTRSLDRQWVYNESYTENDEHRTDKNTGLSLYKRKISKVRFAEENTDDSEITSKSEGHVIPEEKVGETEIKKDKQAYSDPYVAYKSFDNDGSSEIKNTDKDDKKTKLIFFDEIRKPFKRAQDSDLEMATYSLDSIEKSKVIYEREGKKTHYTMMKSKPESRGSTPEVRLDKVKVDDNPKQDCTKSENISDEKVISEGGSDTKEQRKDGEEDSGKAYDQSRNKQSKKTAEEDIEKATGEAKLEHEAEIGAAEKPQPKDVVYGKEALKHYKFYLQIEKKVKKQKLQAELESKLQEYDWKLAAIDEMIVLAKDYYMNPESKNAARWKDLKRNVKKSSSHQIGHTEHRRKLGTLPDYRPLFTYCIIFAQLICFIVTCGLYGFTYIGLEPRLTVESDIKTFMGMETIHKWTAPNLWIGPSDRHLIGAGAVFAPCMRTDIQLQFEQSQQNYSTDTPLGCCEVTSRNVAGTTTELECIQLTEGVGKWMDGLTCANRPPTSTGTRHNMKPCCLGVKGQCRLLSHKHCVFLEGTFHKFGPEHCSQVMCLENICRPGTLKASAVSPWQPDSPAQWWRVPLSLLYHHGILQFVLVTATQWMLLPQIECTAGWFRMLVIYLTSGTMSLLTSAIFLPYQGHVGGVGAVCGMVGMVFVELFHFWKLVRRPFIELTKLSAVVILLLFLGTFPYLDIFGMITGLVTGALLGIILLPYITFGRWHFQIRIILIVLGSTLMFALFYFLLQVFAYVQSVESCEGCKTLNCLPYTEKMCDTSLWQQF